ncbi:hypothetical protein OCU04_009436 [Sclerotinia nivalis]|uniref:Uncharacterized protein n=1 Tax=Sclerotinia nivalis TaxID=352851 RepID=A0A9X0AFX7_9HELO|nr:hypothetical protein OCU04_009436 [Sclerotinia nivalis]
MMFLHGNRRVRHSVRILDHDSDFRNAFERCIDDYPILHSTCPSSAEVRHTLLLRNSNPVSLFPQNNTAHAKTSLTDFKIVGALIGETVLLHRAEHSQDLIINAWTSTIASQVVLSLSFIVPCLPYLKPSLESLDSGILENEFYEESHRIGQLTTRSKTNATGDSSFTLQRLGGRNKLSTKISSRSYNVTSGKERLPSDDVTIAYKGIKRSNMSVGSNASQSKMIKVRTSLDWEVEREHGHEGIE